MNGQCEDSKGVVNVLQFLLATAFLWFFDDYIGGYVLFDETAVSCSVMFPTFFWGVDLIIGIDVEPDAADE